MPGAHAGFSEVGTSGWTPAWEQEPRLSQKNAAGASKLALGLQAAGDRGGARDSGPSICTLVSWGPSQQAWQLCGHMALLTGGSCSAPTSALLLREQGVSGLRLLHPQAPCSKGRSLTPCGGEEPGRLPGHPRPFLPHQASEPTGALFQQSPGLSPRVTSSGCPRLRPRL